MPEITEQPGTHFPNREQLSGDWIRVRGARVHNLKNIDVDIPRDKLVVITGVSGSGKSSLAFDTLFAEGQRRYLECLSARTRQHLTQLERPDVDSVTGLPPTICVDQKVGSARIRSTLATTTEIYDYLRLLYARAGQAHCPDCNVPVSQQSVATIVARILALGDRRKVMILAPLVVGRKGAHRDVFEKICKVGFVRARVDGEIVDAGSPPDLPRGEVHTIEAVVDRIIVKPGIESRLRESVELALKHGDGSCLVCEQVDDGWNDQLFSSRYCCPDCGTSFPPLEPRSFSFNSPYGACPACRGLGRKVSPEIQAKPHKLRTELTHQPLCTDCGGARLAPVSRAVTFAGTKLHELTAMTVAEADEFVRTIELNVAPEVALAAQSILPEVASRLEFLLSVGVDYLTLDRPAPTLSGGEFQRARLASSLGSGLIGICYVLDEPTIGLHSRDTNRMIDVLRDLRDRGNSVLVVEHDVDLMRASQWLVDLGPGAGKEGGTLIWSGPPAEIIGDSPTAVALSPTSKVENAPRARSESTTDRKAIADFEQKIRLEGARRHNLNDVTVEIPLGVLTVVTGVSGCGKSSLITHSLIPAARHAINEFYRRPRLTAEEATPPATDLSQLDIACRSISGTEHVDRLVVVDQSPIGRSGRSNPATHTGLWDEIRKVFAKTRDARVRGFKARRFSFNAKDGRCPKCEGRGTQRIEMNFLPDVHIECPDCRGSRFNSQTLGVKYRGSSVGDVLKMRIDEACEFFKDFPKLNSTLKVMGDVGLGYLELGQSALTLSGGEAQRIKLAAELGKGGEQKVLYVLDEPTTGLHPADVARLLVLFRRLIKNGNSVLVVEHQLDVIAAADWIIDLGPEGGETGGQIVATGTPLEFAAAPQSGHTAKALRTFMEHIRSAM
ncbi:MAG: ABC-ATPase UvrA [Rhodopirellula sp.]|nr:ABC-ATPase UvrA [Rhodopirellula sp.]